MSLNYSEKNVGSVISIFTSSSCLYVVDSFTSIFKVEFSIQYSTGNAMLNFRMYNLMIAHKVK